MCGRYVFRRIDLLRRALDPVLFLPPFEDFDEKRIVPCFNIAPSQDVPILRINSAGKLVLSFTRWGLIPSWTKGEPKLQPINARAETVPTSAMFRQAFDRRRCLVPADGFYEWQGAKPPKKPFFMHKPDDGIFAFAGLWERWKPEPAGEPVDTCTINTTTPNATMAPIHNRMPVILNETDYAKWLDRQTPGKSVADLLQPYVGELVTTPVSTRVNSAKNEGPDLVEPTD